MRLRAGITAAATVLEPQVPAGYYWTGAGVAALSGRALPNLVALTPPTNNIVPDPFVMLDEQGDSTPTRSMFDSGITDPLGGNRANILGWTAQFQPCNHIVRANSPGLPSDAYTSRVQIKKADSTTGNIGIGTASGTAGEFTSVAITDSWQTLQHTNSAYSPASVFDLGIRQNSGGGTVNAALFCLQMYDSASAGDIPTPAEELAASQAGHVKAPAAYESSIPVDANGWIDPSLDANFFNLVAAFPRLAVTELTIGGWVDVVNPTTGSTYGHLIGVAAQGSGENNTEGTLGFYKDTYRLYVNPALSTFASRTSGYLLGQGPVFLLVTAKQGEVTAYVNGVPVHTETSNPSITGWTGFTLERLTLMAYDGSKKRTQKGNYLNNKANHFLFEPRHLTQAEVSEADAYARGKIADEGGSIGPRRAAVIGCGDSLTAFSPSPFWQVEKAASLRPGLHTYLDAIGGSRFGSGVENAYDSATRQGFRRQMMSAALAADFEQVLVQWQYGTNDLVGGVMDNGDWEGGRDTIDAMIEADHQACDDGSGRLKKVIVTIPAHGTLSAEREASRLAYNADRRLNYQNQGYDYLIDLAAYVPDGFASLEAAAADAVANGENSVYLSDGVHWSATGGQDAATELFVPFYESVLA